MVHLFFAGFVHSGFHPFHKLVKSPPAFLKGFNTGGSEKHNRILDLLLRHAAFRFNIFTYNPEYPGIIPPQKIAVFIRFYNFTIIAHNFSLYTIIQND